MGVEVWPCERCNGSGHVGWFRLTPCPSCRASIRKHLPTGTAGVKYLDSVLVAIVCDVRGGMSTTAILNKYRAALAASTRTTGGEG